MESCGSQNHAVGSFPTDWPIHANLPRKVGTLHIYGPSRRNRFAGLSGLVAMMMVRTGFARDCWFPLMCRRMRRIGAGESRCGLTAASRCGGLLWAGGARSRKQWLLVGCGGLRRFRRGGGNLPGESSGPAVSCKNSQRHRWNHAVRKIMPLGVFPRIGRFALISRGKSGLYTFMARLGVKSRLSRESCVRIRRIECRNARYGKVTMERESAVQRSLPSDR